MCLSQLFLKAWGGTEVVSEFQTHSIFQTDVIQFFVRCWFWPILGGNYPFSSFFAIFDQNSSLKMSKGTILYQKWYEESIKSNPKSQFCHLDHENCKKWKKSSFWPDFRYKWRHSPPLVGGGDPKFGMQG